MTWFLCVVMTLLCFWRGGWIEISLRPVGGLNCSHLSLAIGWYLKLGWYLHASVAGKYTTLIAAEVFSFVQSQIGSLEQLFFLGQIFCSG